MQVLEQPSEDAGCGVVSRKDDSDNVICYLGIISLTSPSAASLPRIAKDMIENKRSCCLQAGIKFQNCEFIAETKTVRLFSLRLEKFKDDFLDLRDGGAESGGQERGEDQLLELGMIRSLMKEERFWSNDLLFAGRICGLKEMSLADQDDPSCFGTGYHHARTPQYVGNEVLRIICMRLRHLVPRHDTATRNDPPPSIVLPVHNAVFARYAILLTCLTGASIDIPISANSERAEIIATSTMRSGSYRRGTSAESEQLARQENDGKLGTNLLRDWINVIGCLIEKRKKSRLTGAK
nr:hypothetical protein Iba_chr12fCG18500 [Ipomoea batatas]